MTPDLCSICGNVLGADGPAFRFAGEADSLVERFVQPGLVVAVILRDRMFDATLEGLDRSGDELAIALGRWLDDDGEKLERMVLPMSNIVELYFY